MDGAGDTRAGARKRPVARALAVFSPPERRTGGYTQMQELALRVQLAIVAGIFVLAWLSPGLTQRERYIVTGLIVVQAGYALVSAQAGRLGEPVRVASLFTDVAAPFAFAFAVPAMRLPVLFVVFLYIAFHSFVAGRIGGLVLGAWATLLAVAAELRAPAVDRHSAFEILAYALGLGAGAFLLDGIGAERRRHARKLARVQEALESVSAEPDLQATLDSVSSAAQKAVGAMLVAVLRPERGALTSLSQTADVGDAGDANKRALDEPDASPSGVALQTGQTVVVDEFATDERFSHWAPTADQFGFKSMVVVPFGPPGSGQGTLNVYFDQPGAVGAEDVDLLETFSRQAALLVARAEAFEREREADQLKSQFVATVSHELRTPLTAVHGFVATVLDRWDQLSEDERRDLLRRADRNAAELRRLVEQVLDFTTIEAGQLAVVQERVSPTAAIRKLADDLEPALLGHPVEVHGDPDLTVTADPRGFSRIVSNLLTNAAKHSPQGAAVRVHCARSAAPAEGMAFIDVIDSGPGVAEGEEEKIFERFYRTGEPGLQRGTGIGLAVARSFADLMGAGLSVHRPIEGGACFRLSLPVAPAASEEPTALDA